MRVAAPYPLNPSFARLRRPDWSAVAPGVSVEASAFPAEPVAAAIARTCFAAAVDLNPASARTCSVDPVVAAAVDSGPAWIGRSVGFVVVVVAAAAVVVPLLSSAMPLTD